MTAGPGLRETLRDRTLLAITCLALAARCVVFFVATPWDLSVHQERVDWADARLYTSMAVTLIEHHRFARGPDATPEAIRTPVYPLFIAAVYSVFGQAPWAVLAAQILIDTVACAILYVALRRVVGYRPASVAAVFYALDPTIIFYSAATLLSDSLFVFFFLVSSSLFLFANGSTAGWAPKIGFALSGLFLGIATLIRPSSQFVPLLLIGLILLWNRHTLRIALRSSLVLVVTFLLVVTPWIVRNEVMFGRTSLSALPPYYLLVETVAQMRAIQTQGDSRATRVALLGEAEQLMRDDGLDPGETDQFKQSEYWQRLVVKYISMSPQLFVRAYIYGSLHTFANMPSSTYARLFGMDLAPINIKVHLDPAELFRVFSQERGLMGIVPIALLGPHLALSYLGALIGMFVWWRHFDRRYFWFLLLVIAYFVVITGATGLARYRMPVVPAYLAFAGVGLSFLFDRAAWQTRRDLKRDLHGEAEVGFERSHGHA